MKINELANYQNVQVVLNIADLKELFLEWQSQVNNNAAKEEEVYLTPGEVVSKYHTSKVPLWRNVKSGAWPKPVKIGGKTLYRKSEIEKVLNPDKIGG